MTIAARRPVNENTPSATTGTIELRVADDTGQPVSGEVIRLSGTTNRKTITDASGAYHFDQCRDYGLLCRATSSELITPSLRRTKF